MIVGFSKLLQFPRQAVLLVELIGLFILLPLVLRFWAFPKMWFMVMFACTAGVGTWLILCKGSLRRFFWHGKGVRTEWYQLKKILSRFLLNAVLLVALVLIFFPNKLFNLPSQTPFVWASLLFFYPLLSVYPQEVLYRAFFFERYNKLFTRKRFLIAFNALAFSFMHILYQNPIAILLTLIGGWFFAETYARTRSMRLVWLEHALYGCLVFTIGLGDYFYHGNVS
jgi:hypothetical protein